MASVSGDTDLPPVDNDTCCGSTCSSSDTDIARWFPNTHNTVSFWIEKGPHECSNMSANGKYPHSKKFYTATK